MTAERGREFFIPFLLLSFIFYNPNFILKLIDILVAFYGLVKYFRLANAAKGQFQFSNGWLSREETSELQKDILHLLLWYSDRA